MLKCDTITYKLDWRDNHSNHDDGSDDDWQTFLKAEIFVLVGLCTHFNTESAAFNFVNGTEGIILIGGKIRYTKLVPIIDGIKLFNQKMI